MKSNDHRPTEEAYAELQQAYDYYNAQLFGSQLPACLITFQRVKRTMGYLSTRRFVHRDGRQTDELAMNPEYFAVIPLIEILQTVVHEQCHLWQDHFGHPSRACYHNREWANKMESVGLMPSSTGALGGGRTGQHMNDYVIAGGPFERVTRRLLETGFAISWFDRYPAMPPRRSPAFSIPPGTSLATWLDAIAPGTTTTLPADVPPSAANSVPAQTLPGLGLEVREGSGGRRNKYTCPECRQVTVWGRPNLRIICADCEVLLSDLPLEVEMQPSQA